MRGAVVSMFVLSLLWPMAVLADPVTFQPQGCVFALTFPDAPKQTQLKQPTDRGDPVVTYKAELHSDIDGKANVFRAECTVVPHMGFVDESILMTNMRDLAASYRFESPDILLQHNAVAGPVGLIRGRMQLGGKAIMIELRRYTATNTILDVWTGAEADVFPSGADTAFLKSLTLDGRAIP